MDKLDKQASTITTITVNGRRHAVMPFSRINSAYDDPNYRGTGKAFLGILEKNGSITEFRERWKRSKFKIENIK